jgi:group II intron reverse transcriptase/maturase
VVNNQKIDGAEEQLELFKRRRREIPTAERLQTLQEKLYQKAKQEPEYKFYILYDKTFITYVLKEAWQKVRATDSAAGIDFQTVSDVEKYGVEKYLHEIGEELRKQTYQPKPIKRIYIEKANGAQRPIGVGCIKDRIVQTVCKFIIEPIFEADFTESSHGFRPERSSKGAIREIKENLQEGKTEVYDADLSAYFDTIPHNKLYAVLKMRIADPRLMKLIDKFLKVPIQEDGKITGGKSNKMGVPQGGIISPLLANTYMNLIDKAIDKETGQFHKLGVQIVRYADDFVLMAREMNEEVLEKLKGLLTRMDLKINEEKTRRINAKDESFSFLGFTFRYDKDRHGRNIRYWNIIPGKKSINKLKEKIREILHSSLHLSPDKLVEKLNELLRGWLNYFDIKGVSYTACARREIRYYLNTAMYRYYNRKSQRKSSMYGQQAFELLVKKYKLIDPIKY